MDEVPGLDDTAADDLDDDGLHRGASLQRVGEWSGFFVCSTIVDRSQLTEYEAAEILIVEDPQQLRALGGEVRARIATLLRSRAASVTELANALGMPKGTVGHHVKVLEQAGLIRVVATRKVRAVTEKYYGRVARLFVLKSDESLPDEPKGGVLAARMLRLTADELLPAGVDKDASAIVHIRLREVDVRRFQRRLNRLVADFQSADDAEGDVQALTYAFFRSNSVLPPPDGDGDDAR